MNRIRFGIVGSGWRSLYYVRIAKALPDLFEVTMMLCRTPEKADRIREEQKIRTTISESEFMNAKPEFIVVAVDKAHVADVSMEWLQKGYPVLCETPGAYDERTLELFKNVYQRKQKLVTAEQYLRYPENIARRKVIDQNLIGEPYYVYLSLAHEYHGASLMRHFLEIPSDTPYTIQAAQWSFPTAETLSRYESILDGRVSMKTRTAAMITFENGKACLYDFDSEQYRSPIRSNHVRIQGVRGEIADDTVIWLNEDNHACRESLNTERRIVTTDSANPNLSRFEEIVFIRFGSETLYEPPFGLCGLSQDETALASLLNDMGKYARDEGSAPYDLKESLQDAEMALRLKESIR